MARKSLLKGLKRPKGVSFEQQEGNSNFGRFVAYPFERGFGHTIGNSLRRILLSSIQGYAVAAIRIQSYKDGNDTNGHVISNEFEAVPGVVEDLPSVIQNLKLLHLALPEDVYDRTILIECRGQDKLTGADFEKDGVTVLNKDFVVCNLMPSAIIDIEVQVNFGRGYVPAEVNASDIDVVGTLPVDSIFSPVERVQLSVENYRLGNKADYDKLVLDVWTNGVISPVDALAEAAKIAKEHFSVFINFDESSISADDEIDEDEQRLRVLLETSVAELELSVRSANCLKNAQIITLKDLTRKTEDDLARTRNFGKKSLQEIKEKLSEWGLSLAMVDYSSVKESLKLGKSLGKREE